MTAPILMVSYECPPRLSAQAIQTAKILKAIAGIHDDWVIDLVCASPGDEVAVDPELEALLPKNVRVHPIDPVSKGRKTLLQRIIGGKGGWQKSAYARTMALFPAEHKKPALIYSRSHPPASHLVALDLVQGPMKGVPWVAHFSDPWSQNPNYKSPVTRAALARYETQVFDSAARLLFASEALMESALAKASDEIRAKARVVPPVFDPPTSPVAPSEPAPPPESSPVRQRVYHIGNFYGLRTPAPLLAGLEALDNQSAASINRLDIQLVGWADVDSEQVLAIAPGYIHRRAPVSYQQSLALMSQADVLLAIGTPVVNSVFFPTKLMDYLGAGKPILAIAPRNSETQRLMERWNQRWCATDDTAAIAVAFKDIADGALWSPPPADAGQRYAASSVGRQIVELWTEILGEAADEKK